MPVTIDHKGAVSAFAVMCVAAAGVFGVIGKSSVTNLPLGLRPFGLYQAVKGFEMKYRKHATFKCNGAFHLLFFVASLYQAACFILAY